MIRPTLDAQGSRAALGAHAPEDADDVDVLTRYATAVWSHLTEPGDGAAGRLIAVHGVTGALHAVLAGGAAVEGLSRQELAAGRKRWLPRADAPAIEHALRVATRAGARLLVRGDAEWPHQLDDLAEHAPIALWVRGRVELLARLQPSVAVVGARAATSYGDHVAADLAADLAGSGIAVVSGAAYGIDGAAHRAALAVGGDTVALVAGGVDRAYPAGHTDLIGRIAARGALVGEVPCGSAPTKWRFLQRNRLIAALTNATVVVEAGWRSGSLNTASHAATLGRGLGAVPGPVTSAASAGTHRLLREYGAECITSGADVREMLGLQASGTPTRHDGRPRTDDAARVRDALGARAWRSTDDVARRAGIARADVEAILGILQLAGDAERGADGWRRGGLFSAV
ncbi:DNA-processing protein DprA [Microbacterium sp. 2FI]|uniref:DNA-processing protein DprA n=1 Tax=Microbacterium sp. 2FI TaxID=2502193 RepID=UPI0010F8DF7E|nr:DNA-processing protein DprA [Microbacterium sp. 2FI]